LVKSVLIDCDPGIDDALALLLALRSPEVSVKAITAVYGNAAVSETCGNIVKILKLAKVTERPALGRGSSEPLTRPRPERAGAHGSNGLADIGIPSDSAGITIHNAVNLIIETILSGQVRSVIALGPLTNIARAVMREPKITKRLDELIIMGGALQSIRGFDAAEFNMNCDPEAVREVLRSSLPVKLITLDVTQRVVFTEEHVKPFEGIDSSLARFVTRLMQFSICFNRDVRKQEGALLHDPLAVGIAIDSTLGTFTDVSIEVDVNDMPGAITLKSGKPNVSLCRDVDAERFLDIFMERLSQYCRQLS
jgi:inosine-uridine nucleoside N-ribohydrolase